MILMSVSLVQTGPGNWIARKVGLEEAPTTIDESVSALIKKVNYPQVYHDHSLTQYILG